MKQANKPTNKYLKRLLIATAVIGLLYVASFLVFALLAGGTGDPELNSFVGVLQYHLKGIVDLFLFRYAGNANVMYFALSAFLYALLVAFAAHLIVGIVVSAKKKRRFMWWAIALTGVNVILYLVFASGAEKYWLIANSLEAFAEHHQLMYPTLMIILFGTLHYITSLGSYFWSIVECYMNPGMEAEAEEKAPQEEPVDVRQIVREELLRLQPLKVEVINALAMPVQEEHHEELHEEEVPPQEEPLQPTVTFEEAAEEIWPQLKEQPLEAEAEEEPEEDLEDEGEEEEGELQMIPGMEYENETTAMAMEVPAESIEETNFFDTFENKKRMPFAERILRADPDVKAKYNELKNEILSYRVKARMSKNGEFFRLHRKAYVKIFLVGKTLKVYLAVNPEDYVDSTYPFEDVGYKPAYAGMPFLFRVRSGLSVRRCKKLIKSAMEKDGLKQKEVLDINWVSELRKQRAEKLKAQKENAKA